MIQVIRSDQRHHADHGWLSTNWHFSFGDYYDPQNMNWGPLRVFNDDVVQPSSGFPMHPHRDMEIITYVIDGQLEHRDGLGNQGVIGPGEVQVMSAGKGIVHSELNSSSDQSVHLLQLWVLPRSTGHAPRWEQRLFDPGAAKGKLLPIVSPGDIPETLSIDQNASIYVARLNNGQRALHQSTRGEHVYLFVIEGTITVNGQELSHGDQARMKSEKKLDIVAKTDAHLMLLDLP